MYWPRCFHPLWNISDRRKRAVDPHTDQSNRAVKLQLLLKPFKSPQAVGFPWNDNARFVFVPAFFRATITDYTLEHSHAGASICTSAYAKPRRDKESTFTQLYSYTLVRHKYENLTFDVYQVPRRQHSRGLAYSWRRVWMIPLTERRLRIARGLFHGKRWRVHRVKAASWRISALATFEVVEIRH